MSTMLDDPISALSLSTPSFLNSNIRRNRVPGEAELLGLQALVESNARTADILDTEIMHLNASYNSIHTRYAHLQREMDATQSELHNVNDLLVAAQIQRAALQVKQDDLRALMHPIRRCPHEILAEIFEWTIICMHSYGGIARQSVHLSSVCQHWRSVALNTPRLWSYISFTLDESSESQRFLRACILPRLRQVPATVNVWAINSNTISTLSECALRDIPVIRALTLMVSTPADIQHIIGPSSHPLIGTLEVLHIHSLTRPCPQLNITNYNISRLVARFPPFHTLGIHGVPNPYFTVTVTNPNITQLDISDSGLLDILGLLQCFPRLRYLEIRRSVLMGGLNRTTYHVPSIESICLIDTMGEAWLEAVFFPNLTTISCSTGSEAFRAFLSRHPSITELGIIMQGDAIISIMTVAAQLKKLAITPPLGSFCRLIDSGSQRFTSLESFIITTSRPPNNLTLTDFETVVRALCLPIRHPKRRAAEGSPIVSSFAIITMDLATAGGYLAWHESALYKQSTKRVGQCPGKVYLSWPEWE